MKFSPIIKKTYLFLFFSWVFLISCDHNAMKVSLSRYPDGKNFAFTITEDPDYGTLSQKKIIYSFLDSLGLKTTIAVWVMDNKNGSGNKLSRTNTRGVSTTDSAYLTFLKQFQEKGFEICLHTVSPGNDYREETQAGYELFKSQFGAYAQIRYPPHSVKHCGGGCAAGFCFHHGCLCWRMDDGQLLCFHLLFGFAVVCFFSYSNRFVPYFFKVKS